MLHHTAHIYRWYGVQQNKLIYLIYKNHARFFLIPMSFHLCVAVFKTTTGTYEEIDGHACIMHFIYLQTNKRLISSISCFLPAVEAT